MLECSANEYYHLLVVSIKFKCKSSDKEVMLAIRDHPIAMFHIVAGRGSGIVPET